MSYKQFHILGFIFCQWKPPYIEHLLFASSKMFSHDFKMLYNFK